MLGIFVEGGLCQAVDNLNPAKQCANGTRAIFHSLSFEGATPEAVLAAERRGGFCEVLLEEPPLSVNFELSVDSSARAAWPAGETCIPGRAVLPAFTSSKLREFKCLSIFAARSGITKFHLEQHSVVSGFVPTDFKEQGMTEDYLIASLNKRHFQPNLRMQSVYVIISRVCSLGRLRTLHELHEDDFKGLGWPEELGVWDRSYVDGYFSAERARQVSGKKGRQGKAPKAGGGVAEAARKPPPGVGGAAMGGAAAAGAAAGRAAAGGAQARTAAKPAAARQSGTWQAAKPAAKPVGKPVTAARSVVLPEAPYLEHACVRFAELRRLLLADPRLTVTFPGVPSRSGLQLGTGLAAGQWRDAGLQGGWDGVTAQKRFVEWMQAAAWRLLQEFAGRVFYGHVSGAGASSSTIMVWGANAANIDLPDGTKIEGLGQALSMGKQKAGVFGIVTTPVSGPPPTWKGAAEPVMAAAAVAAGAAVGQRGAAASSVAAARVVGRAAGTRSTGGLYSRLEVDVDLDEEAELRRLEGGAVGGAVGPAGTAAASLKAAAKVPAFWAAKFASARCTRGDGSDGSSGSESTSEDDADKGNVQVPPLHVPPRSSLAKGLADAKPGPAGAHPIRDIERPNHPLPFPCHVDGVEPGDSGAGVFLPSTLPPPPRSSMPRLPLSPWRVTTRRRRRADDAPPMQLPAAKSPRRSECSSPESPIEGSPWEMAVCDRVQARNARRLLGGEGRYDSLAQMLCELERFGAQGSVVRVPGDHCCWLWAVGVGGGTFRRDEFVVTPSPRTAQTVRAFGLVGWMRRQRLAVNKWLETEAGQALVARMPMLTIKTLYRCATRAAVAAKVKDEDEWGRSIYMHALAQVM